MSGHFPGHKTPNLTLFLTVNPTGPYSPDHKKLKNEGWTSVKLDFSKSSHTVALALAIVWQCKEGPTKLAVLRFRSRAKTVAKGLLQFILGRRAEKEKGKVKRKARLSLGWAVAWSLHYTIDDKEWFCCLAANRRIISPLRAQEGETSRQRSDSRSPQGRECWAPINYRVQCWNIRLSHCLEAGGTLPAGSFILLSALRWLGGI